MHIRANNSYIKANCSLHHSFIIRECKNQSVQNEQYDLGAVHCAVRSAQYNVKCTASRQYILLNRMYVLQEIWHYTVQTAQMCTVYTIVGSALYLKLMIKCSQLLWNPGKFYDKCKANISLSKRLEQSQIIIIISIKLGAMKNRSKSGKSEQKIWQNSIEIYEILWRYAANKSFLKQF